MKRTIETAQFIEQDKVITVQDRDDPSVLHEWKNLRIRKWPYLDEIFAGLFVNIMCFDARPHVLPCCTASPQALVTA